MAPSKDPACWPVKLNVLLQQLFPENANISLKNGARGGTRSTCMSHCFAEHVPKDADVRISAMPYSLVLTHSCPPKIIKIEYALNDPWQSNPRNTLDNSERRVAGPSKPRLGHNSELSVPCCHI